MLSREEEEKLSTHSTSLPWASSRSHRCEPMKPEPPVTRTVLAPCTLRLLPRGSSGMIPRCHRTGPGVVRRHREERDISGTLQPGWGGKGTGRASCESHLP